MLRSGEIDTRFQGSWAFQPSQLPKKQIWGRNHDWHLRIVWGCWIEYQKSPNLEVILTQYTATEPKSLLIFRVWIAKPTASILVTSTKHIFGSTVSNSHILIPQRSLECSMQSWRWFWYVVRKQKFYPRLLHRSWLVIGWTGRVKHRKRLWTAVRGIYISNLELLTFSETWNWCDCRTILF